MDDADVCREWVSLQELAARRGVSKQAISKRLKRMERDGLIKTRREGRKKMVPLALFESLASRDDVFVPPPDSAENLPAPEPDIPADPEYLRERAREKRFKADLAEIQLRRERQELVEIAQVEAAIGHAAEILVRGIDQLPGFADDLATALSREGIPGLRKALKTKARDLRQTLSDNLKMPESS